MNANNGINFDNTTEPKETPVNSFGGSQVGLNSPILGQDQAQMNSNTPVVNNISIDSKGIVQEINVTQDNPNLCPFCGFKVNVNTNMCMHCGRILGNANNQKGIMGAPTIAAEQNVEYIDLISQNPKPILICTIIFLVIGLIGIIAAGLLLNNPIYILSIFPYGIFLFYSYCIERLMMKANLPWWGYLIPVYNIFLMSKLLTNRYLYIIWYLIPIGVFYFLSSVLAKSILLYFGGCLLIFEIVIMFTMVTKFSERFNVNNLLLFFFPYIMIPLMALKERYVCF